MTNPDQPQLHALLHDVAERSARYLNSLDERSVAPAPDALAALAGFQEALPQNGQSADSVLAQLDGLGSPASVAMAGPRYFGFVIGGSYPAALAASWLATAWDQNAVLHEVTPAISILEQVALEWMLDLLGLPPDCGAAYVTGATVANLTGLAAARHAVLDAVGWPIEANGLFGAPDIQVLVGGEVHPSLSKSLGLLGLGRSRVTCIPVDGQGRMQVDALPEITGPSIICTQAGNVNTGAIDPIGEICHAVRDTGAWVHVDGAFGLWALAAPEFEQAAAGIRLADSWATDAHKWLNVPYDSGVCFVRHPHALKAAMSITAEYLPTESSYRNPSDFTPELSRRARGVEIWAVLKHLGRDGVAELVSRCCAHARRFAAALSGAGFEILNDVSLNQVLVSFGDEAATRKIIDAVQRDGTCWAGITVWQGRAAMRISVSNWSTTTADVDASVAAIIRVAQDCSQ